MRLLSAMVTTAWPETVNYNPPQILVCPNISFVGVVQFPASPAGKTKVCLLGSKNVFYRAKICLRTVRSFANGCRFCSHLSCHEQRKLGSASFFSRFGGPPGSGPPGFFCPKHAFGAHRTIRPTMPEFEDYSASWRLLRLGLGPDLHQSHHTKSS